MTPECRPLGRMLTLRPPSSSTTTVASRRAPAAAEEIEEPSDEEAAPPAVPPDVACAARSSSASVPSRATPAVSVISNSTVTPQPSRHVLALGRAGTPSTSLPCEPLAPPGSKRPGATVAVAELPAPKRSSLVSGLALGATQLGDARPAAASSGGGKRRSGLMQQLVARTVTAAAALSQELHVKWGICGSAAAPPDTVRAAMADPELRHVTMRLLRVHSKAPLVVATCEVVEGDAVHRAPADQLVVILQRAVFERTCCTGPHASSTFVVFGPLMEQRRDRLLLAQYCEPLAQPHEHSGGWVDTGAQEHGAGLALGH